MWLTYARRTAEKQKDQKERSEIFFKGNHKADLNVAHWLH